MICASCSILSILKGIEGLGFIASLICLSFVFRLSKTDPFEEHIIGNISIYFNYIPNSKNTTAKIERQNNYSNDEEFSPIYKEEAFVRGNKSNFSESTINKKLFLRRLASSCNGYRIKFDRYHGRDHWINSCNLCTNWY